MLRMLLPKTKTKASRHDENVSHAYAHIHLDARYALSVSFNTAQRGGKRSLYLRSCSDEGWHFWGATHLEDIEIGKGKERVEKDPQHRLHVRNHGLGVLQGKCKVLSLLQHE